MHADEQLKRWKERFITILNRITFDEPPPPFVDDMANHHNIRIWTAAPNSSDYILINAQRSKATNPDCLLCRTITSIDS